MSQSRHDDVIDFVVVVVVVVVVFLSSINLCRQSSRRHLGNVSFFCDKVSHEKKNLLV